MSFFSRLFRRTNAAPTTTRLISLKLESEPVSETVAPAAVHPPVRTREQLRGKRDYARTLLQRTKAKDPAPAPPARVSDSALVETLEELCYAVKAIQERLGAPIPPVEPLIGRREQIVQMLDSGDAVDETARKLRLPPGEVEFVSRVRQLSLQHT